METFGRLVAAQCPSFSQRRALLKAMKEMQARFTSFEERMTNMQQLSKDEDELYNSAQDLPEKIAQLEKQLEVGHHLNFIHQKPYSLHSKSPVLNWVHGYC